MVRERMEDEAGTPDWGNVVRNTILESYHAARRALHSTGAAEFADRRIRGLLADNRHDNVQSAFAAATLVDKERLRRLFRLPMVHTNPVYDEMSDTKPRADLVPLNTATGISFDLLLEEDLWNPRNECLSHVRVWSWHEWDERIANGGAPNEHGPLDERMGPVRATHTDGRTRFTCPECAGYNNVDQYVNERLGEPGMCVGHFGHIQLPCAVWNPMMESTVQHMLGSFCWHCGSLPGTDAQNMRIVADMYRKCETRAAKVSYLDSCYREMATCAQCAKHRRCAQCQELAGDAPTLPQCPECEAFRYYRPKLRTVQQADNKKRALYEHMIEHEDMDAMDDDARRSVRGSNYTGFPCEALLAGNAALDDDSYQRFALAIYGREADNTVLVMHGERVRAVIEQMSDDFLRLFFETALDTCDQVRAWFRSMVPRVVPVIPNPARPTDIGHGGGSATIRTDDLTKRYKELLKRCIALSRNINPQRKDEMYATLYDNNGNRANIYASRRNTWFKPTDADWRHIELMAEIQYYYAAVLSDTRALRFLSGVASSHGIGRSAAARQRRAANEAGGGGAGGDHGNDVVLVSSIERRLHGKKGRLRGNLEGKRVEDSARTVITPDHKLSIRWVRVPFTVAAILIVKERVNALNVRELVLRAERYRTNDTTAKRHELRNGTLCKGCAECEELAYSDRTELCIFNAAGDERVRITGRNCLQFPVMNHPFVQEAGAIVERTVRTGDYLLMNRQPSLHKHSTMMHRVIVGYSSTAGLQELATTPYNADFDGDEMNMHRATCISADIEAIELMKVSAQLISTSDSAPVHGLKQNAATGIYKMTSPNTFLTKDVVCDLLVEAMPYKFAEDNEPPRLMEPAVRYKDKETGEWHELWTGLQIAGYALPQRRPKVSPKVVPRLNFQRPASAFDVDRELFFRAPDGKRLNRQRNASGPMLIIDGEFMFGRLDKSVTGASVNSIMRAIWDRTGASLSDSQEAVCDFIDRCAWLASAFLTVSGFTMGLGPCIPRPQHAAKIAQATLVASKEIATMLREDKELMETGQHADRVTTIEERAMEIENTNFQRVMALCEEAMEPDNELQDMLISGGKGKILNAVQIFGCLGGQQVEGRRVVDYTIGARDNSGLSAGAGNNDRSETTSTGTGAKRWRPSRSNLGTMPSSRLLDNLLMRQSPHTQRGLYPGASEGGFIQNSFLTGLTPQEFWAHSKAGREGIVDTAVKTADTGDAQRLAMKSSEGVVVRADQTVRSETNQLVSFRYGGNNYNPAFVMRKPLQFIGMSKAALENCVYYDFDDDVVLKLATEDEVDALRREDTVLREMVKELRAASTIRNSGVEIVTPNNLPNVIIDVLQSMGANTHGARWWSLNDPRVEWERIDVSSELADNETRARQSRSIVRAGRCAQLIDERCAKWRAMRPAPLADYVTECEVRLRLCSKQVTRRLELTENLLVMVLDRYEQALYRTIVPAGESVGALMVQSIGQPATQMTLNTFHFTGKRSLGVLAGVPRMKEISQATPTIKMKGLKVVMPLREGLLLSAGQRKLAAKLAATILTPQALDHGRDGFAQTTRAWEHRDNVARVMQAPSRTAAKNVFAEHRESIERSLSVEAERVSVINHRDRVAAMLEDVDRFFVVKEDEDVGESDARSLPLRTLHALTHKWREVRSNTMRGTAASGWCWEALQTFKRANSFMIGTVRRNQQLSTTPQMMCESVYRALLPVFGSDAAFAVLPRVIEHTGTIGDAKRRAVDAMRVCELAVVALDCHETYEHAMYEHIRLNRHLIFVDMLTPDEEAGVVCIARAAAIDAQYSEPVVFVATADKDSEAAQRARESELLRRKLGDISVAQTRSLFKNLVSTRLIDIVESFALVYEPITIDPETRDVTVKFPERDFIPNDSEREACEMFYNNDCFDSFGVGCQRPLCVEARHNPPPPDEQPMEQDDDDDQDHEDNSHRRRHLDAQVGCLSSWVLAFRLSQKWFLRNDVSAAVVQTAMERALGPFFNVWIGDDNTDEYMPMHVRVYRCQLRLALDETNMPTVTKLDEWDPVEVDKEMLVLDRIKWAALNYAFCGPLHGSAVMCEDHQRQIFTEERGCETIEQPVLVSNSSDLYYLLGLRGIDARRVRSNSIHDMREVLGVEAARMTAMNEYRAVFADGGGAPINRAHYALRADIQTRNGGFLPLSAAGLRSAPHDVCQSASHREQAKTFVNAALDRRIVAPLVSPSANVMLAQPLARNGTGSVVLLSNWHTLKSHGKPLMEPAAVLANMRQDAEIEGDDAKLREWLEFNRTMPPPPPQPAKVVKPEENDDEDEEDAEAAQMARFSPPREEPEPPVAKAEPSEITTFEAFVAEHPELDLQDDLALRYKIAHEDDFLSTDLPEPVLQEPAGADADDEESTSEGEERAALMASTHPHPALDALRQVVIDDFGAYGAARVATVPLDRDAKLPDTNADEVPGYEPEKPGYDGTPGMYDVELYDPTDALFVTNRAANLRMF